MEPKLKGELLNLPAPKGTRAVSGLTAWVLANIGTECPLSGWLGSKRMALHWLFRDSHCSH